MINAEIKKKILEFRSKGCSQRQAAEALSLSRPTIAKYWNDDDSGDFSPTKEGGRRLEGESESDEEIDRMDNPPALTEAEALRERVRIERYGRKLAISKVRSGEREALAAGLESCQRLKNSLEKIFVPIGLIRVAAECGTDVSFSQKLNLTIIKICAGLEDLEKFLDGALGGQATAAAAGRYLKKILELEMVWKSLSALNNENDDLLEKFSELCSVLRILIAVGI